ncbi:hypothetical protein L218DRAFT_952972 [Marasmius fiardii PR-910]|nr:hypothetical protein L218DRAFT_952972 [Marasmius fiardii PR-910]
MLPVVLDRLSELKPDFFLPSVRATLISADRYGGIETGQDRLRFAAARKNSSDLPPSRWHATAAGCNGKNWN